MIKMHNPKSRTPISEILVRIRHCVLRSDLSISLFPFSRALFARVFLFSLAPVYFFLLSSPRTYVIASRFTGAYALSSSSFDSKSPAVIQSDLLTFQSSRMTFFLSLSLSLSLTTQN